MFTISVPEENRVIHSDGELQNGRKSFGDIGNFAEDDITAEVD